MIKGRQILLKEKQIYAKQMNERWGNLEKTNYEIIDKFNKLTEDYTKLDKEFR